MMKCESSPLILYVCDRLRCEKCNNDLCEYTTDISHAANFHKDEEHGVWIEREDAVVTDDVKDKE